MNIKITGSGSYIPTQVVTNLDFANHSFLNEDGSKFPQSNEVVARKFLDITGIKERKYVTEELVTSDIASIAGKLAIEDAKIDPETIDYIIVAHNFGDVKHGTVQMDAVPSLASRVKQKLQIKNPKCVAYDLLFGCPGWIEAVIQAQAYIKAGMAKKCLVIGAETLSRVVDRHDRDSMIYSDGAGATVLEATEEDGGIISFESATFATNEADYLFFGASYNKEDSEKVRYIKMYGRKIYEFALTHVPNAMAECLNKSGYSINDVKKILIHQANEKMDEAIVERFYQIYNQIMPEEIMPMSIRTLGNSSVATVPTLYDLIIKEKFENQQLKKDDVILFASVGAGMNINAFVYKM